MINRNISETEIIETVRDAFQMGWQLVKLYFMVGLPTETAEDLCSWCARFWDLSPDAWRDLQRCLDLGRFLGGGH